MTESLDRPIWHALRSRHAVFAEGGPLALRYTIDVSPFAAAQDDSADSLAALARLIPADRPVILAQARKSPVPPGTVAELVADAVQMVAETVSAPDHDIPFIELTDADAPEMLALATLTKPGPFLARTHDLGGFIGIREQGRLVAMAGERLKVPGFGEVSGVCTHPDARGRGLAGFLTRTVAARMAARGDRPFLHTWASNENAIRLYRALGFVHRTTMIVTVLRRAAS